MQYFQQPSVVFFFNLQNGRDTKALLHDGCKTKEIMHVKYLYGMCHMPPIQQMAIFANEHGGYPENISRPIRIHNMACLIRNPIIPIIYNIAS